MAYITERQEEKRAPIGQSGQAFAGTDPQAGVQGGTGGSKPWVNIQSYLQANPNDRSAEEAINKDFGSALDQNTASVKSEQDRAIADIDKSKSENDASLLGVQNNLQTARNAVFDTVTNQSNVNEYGGAVQRAQDAVTTGPKVPEFNPIGMSGDLTEKAAQLNDPYKYLSQVYNKQGLTPGQRALQEQLTRKSNAVDFPGVAGALSGKYNEAKSGLESTNASLAQQRSQAEQDYRNKFGEADRSLTDYRNDVAGLRNSLGANNQAEWSELAGSPFLGNQYRGDFFEIGRKVDNYRNITSPEDKGGSFQREQWEKVRHALLNKYGFSGK